MKSIAKLSLLALAVASTAAMANTTSDTSGTTFGGKTVVQTLAKPAAFGVEVGTLGYGANISWGVTESVELQAGWTGGKLDADVDVGNNDSYINWNKVLGDDWQNYQGNLKVEAKGDNPYLGLQARPFKNAFTVGTGVIVPNQDISATLTTAQGSGTIKANGMEHTIAAGEVVQINAETKNKLAPYLTVGVRPNINSRFGLSAEIGAAYVGGYDVDVKATDAALAKDMQDELEGDGLKWYPVAKLGATIRF